MSSGRSFALETTLSGKYLVAVIEKLKKLNYAVNIKYIYVANSNEAISRIRCRVMAGGHHIPDQDVVRRFWRSTHNFWYLYKDISNWWSMYLNDTTDLILVAAKTEEGFDIVENRHFEDFKKLL
jgi:predicted ABC-type ATPase